MNYIYLKVKEKTNIKKFLKDSDFSSRSIREILKDGYLINDKAYKGNQKLKENDQVKIIICDENLDYEPKKSQLDIVYEDEHILIVNKSYNLTVNSKNQVSLANHIAYYFKEKGIKAKVRFVNRLDMDTSGLIMIAKNKYAMAYYQKQIEDNKFKKIYLAICEGFLEIDKTIKLKLLYDSFDKNYKIDPKGKEAITYFKRLKYDKNYDLTYVMCDIKTGKTHQIRASLSYLGHPILGDRLYGSEKKTKRFYLHSYHIEVKKYLSSELLSLYSKAFI